jgi:hypothetical protein
MSTDMVMTVCIPLRHIRRRFVMDWVERRKISGFTALPFSWVQMDSNGFKWIQIDVDASREVTADLPHEERWVWCDRGCGGGWGSGVRIDLTFDQKDISFAKFLCQFCHVGRNYDGR